jgi:hypothetical protein
MRDGLVEELGDEPFDYMGGPHGNRDALGTFAAVRSFRSVVVPQVRGQRTRGLFISGARTIWPQRFSAGRPGSVLHLMVPGSAGAGPPTA